MIHHKKNILVFDAVIFSHYFNLFALIALNFLPSESYMVWL